MERCKLKMSYVPSIIVLSVFVLFLGCKGVNTPTPSNAVEVKSLSAHKAAVSSFIIPRGVFRGVLWPSKADNNFQIWIIKHNEEIFFKIPAPVGFASDYNREDTERWNINLSTLANCKTTVMATKTDGSKSVEIILPTKKRQYSFAIFRNSSDEEIVVFMDISEHVVDTGLFGYIMLKK